MAERPFEPVPNTPLVADPTGDAIWKRWLQGLQRFMEWVIRGPGSSTDNAVARWDGTTGTFLQNSGVIIDDSNNVSGVVNLTTTGNATIGNSTSDTLTVNAETFLNADLEFVGNGLRIRGEFSTLTYANRTVVQTSVTDGLTAWEVIPNGTSTVAALNVANSSDNENCAIGQLTATSTNFRFQSNVRGTGTLVPIAFYLNGIEQLTLNTSGTLTAYNKIYPGTDAAASQSAAGIYAGTGAPNNANGNDGDFYFRSDGGLLTTIYQRRAGAWVGVV